MTDPGTSAVVQGLPSLGGAEWLARAETQAVLAALEAAGHEARAVGGVVRNALLGLPVTDIDIATSARPEAVMAVAAAAGLAAVPTGIDHGTVTVVSGHVPYEVTTLRRDVETHGRHATVAFTDDWAADASRRDFTMNALYCDARGQVLDPLGGWPDVAARRVRFIGDADTRIAEDYLRILRFFRFHSVLGAGAPDPAGLAACVRGRAGLARLSAERVRAELLKLLAGPRVADAIAAMLDWGLLALVLGRAPRPAVLAAMIAAEARVSAPPDPILRLAALAVAVEEDVPFLAQRLRLSGDERARLLPIDAHTLSSLPAGDPAAQRRLLYRLRAPGFRRMVLAALAAQSLAAGADTSAVAGLYNLPDRWTPPVLPVQGRDVLALGIPPGPRVGEMLADVERWWIAADFPPEADVRARLTGLARART